MPHVAALHGTFLYSSAFDIDMPAALPGLLPHPAAVPEGLLPSPSCKVSCAFETKVAFRFRVGVHSLVEPKPVGTECDSSVCISEGGRYDDGRGPFQVAGLHCLRVDPLTSLHALNSTHFTSLHLISLTHSLTPSLARSLSLSLSLSLVVPLFWIPSFFTHTDNQRAKHHMS